jgi:hypothetical protein
MPLTTKATLLIRTNFRCTGEVKYYYILPNERTSLLQNQIFIAEGEALLEWPAYCITFSLATTGIEISNISTSCPACSLKFSAKFPRSPSVFDPSSTTVYRLTILKLKKKNQI